MANHHKICENVSKLSTNSSIKYSKVLHLMSKQTYKLARYLGAKIINAFQLFCNFRLLCVYLRVNVIQICNDKNITKFICLPIYLCVSWQQATAYIAFKFSFP